MQPKELLNEVNELEKFDVELPVLTRYAAREIVKSGNPMCFELIPETIKSEILSWINSYQESGELWFVTSEGMEDLSDLMRQLIVLLRV